jgi:hypothetical protein
MAYTTPDVESIAHAIERKPFADQLEKIGIPPKIARVAEIFGRVRIQGAEFVGHDVPTPPPQAKSAFSPGAGV